MVKSDIVLDGPSQGAVFTSGSILRGNIVCQATQATRAQDLELCVYGTEKTLVRHCHADKAATKSLATLVAGQ